MIINCLGRSIFCANEGSLYLPFVPARSPSSPAQLIIKKGGGHPWLTIHEEVEVMADWFVELIVGVAAKESER